MLDDSERSANRRFSTESLRARHACAHALLRRALAQSLGREAASLRFEPGRNDRPRLAGISSEIDFNLSHSGSFVACAVIASGRVGIDVEAVRLRMDYTRVLGHAASPAERSWLEAKTPGQARRDFFRLWVLKEAYAKARGDGLHLPFADITLRPRGEGFEHDLAATGDNPDEWVFALYDINSDAALAVAAKPAGTTGAAVRIEVMEGSELMA